jgi:hypothetical protein
MSRLRLWFRRIVRGVLLLLAVVLVGGLAWIYWQRDIGYRDIQAIVADLDANDPDWRLPAIEAKRRVVPESENGALVAVAAARLLPADWKPAEVDEREVPTPSIRFDEEKTAELRKQLEGCDAALAEGRKMVGYPAGRFKIEYSDEALLAKLPDQEYAHKLAHALEIDASLAIQDKQQERALADIRAIRNIGRSIGDEPTFLSQIIRRVCELRSLDSFERVLAQGTLSETDLEAMQRNFAEDAATERFSVGLRGDRAGMHDFLTRAENDGAPVAVAIGKAGRIKHEASPLDYVTDIPYRVMAYQSHAWILRHETRLLEAAKLTGHERYEALDKLQTEAWSINDLRLLLAKLYVPAVHVMHRAEQRDNLRFGCAAAACAAERYRLKHGKWPADLDELVREKLLPSVPIDLYTGKPLLIRRASDGIVFHSAGWKVRNEMYSGDYLDPESKDRDRFQWRLEFRLWDVAERGKAPPAPDPRLEAPFEIEKEAKER